MVEPMKFTPEQKAALRAEFAPKATDAQWAIFVDECERRALIPGTHVVFSLRSAGEYDENNNWVSVKKVAFMTTINALRLIAKRDGNYRGRKPFQFYYRDTSNKLYNTEIPEGVIPHAVSAEFLRKDWTEALKVVARYDAYVQKKRNGDPTDMWARRGEEQLAKCCEAQGLREIAPEECGGLYIKEELEAEVVDNGAAPAVAAPAPQAIVAPAVNSAPAPEPKAATIETTPFPVTEQAKEAAAKAAEKPAEPQAEPPKSAPEPAKDSAAPLTESAFSGSAPAPTSTSEPDRLPNANEFSMFGARATKLMRETLPKAGVKQAAAALQKYMVAGTGGEKNTRNYTRNQWETLLSALEKASPEQIATLLKGSK